MAERGPIMRVAEPPKTDRPNSGHGIAENQADRPTEVRIAPAARD